MRCLRSSLSSTARSRAGDRVTRRAPSATRRRGVSSWARRDAHRHDVAPVLADRGHPPSPAASPRVRRCDRSDGRGGRTAERRSERVARRHAHVCGARGRRTSRIPRVDDTVRRRPGRSDHREPEWRRRGRRSRCRRRWGRGAPSGRSHRSRDRRRDAFRDRAEPGGDVVASRGGRARRGAHGSCGARPAKRAPDTGVHGRTAIRPSTGQRAHPRQGNDELDRRLGRWFRRLLLLLLLLLLLTTVAVFPPGRVWAEVPTDRATLIVESGVVDAVVQGEHHTLHAHNRIAIGTARRRHCPPRKRGQRGLPRRR